MSDNKNELTINVMMSEYPSINIFKNKLNKLLLLLNLENLQIKALRVWSQRTYFDARISDNSRDKSIFVHVRAII